MMINSFNSEFYDKEDSDNICYLCNKPSYKVLYKVKHFDFPFTFMKCQCGIIKQTPMPNELFFKWFFNSELFTSSRKSKKDEIWGYYDYFADEPCRLKTSKHRYAKLRKVFEENKSLNICKIGPSTGTFLHIANQNGHNAIGCDVSSKFVEYAKNNYNVHIDNGRFERMDYKNSQFDAILLFSVIENVPNQVEFLEAISRKLKNNGLFIFNFVDMRGNLVEKVQKDRYFIYRPPICYVYDLPVMKKVLEKFSFSIIDIFSDIRYMHIEKIATLLGWKWPLTASKLLGINRTAFPIPVYPSRIIVARKVS